MPSSSLHGNRVVPTLKPPFDIIYRIAKEARACESARPAREGVKKQAEGASPACPTLLPLLDELRTYCFEHKIEEIPTLLAV
jgi:hypothetical protein